MERIQKDAQDMANNNVRLVFEKYEGEAPAGVYTNDKGTLSLVHYWIEDIRLDIQFVNPKMAQQFYEACKEIRHIEYNIIEPVEKTKITEEA